MFTMFRRQKAEDDGKSSVKTLPGPQLLIVPIKGQCAIFYIGGVELSTASKTKAINLFYLCQRLTGLRVKLYNNTSVKVM